jgi:purine nucleosidase
VLFYLDCDTGVDDALAIALLLRTPDANLAAIGTVSGNTSADQAARNTLGLLTLAGRDDIPVAVGAHHPLGGSFAGGAAMVHGSNGIGGIDLQPSPRTPIAGDAATLLIELARADPGNLRVIATGPLTNLALALHLEPGLPSLIQDVTVMGGALRVPGNIAGNAEANLGNDPRAAAAVLAADWPLTLVPLDVTMRHRFDEADQEALRAGNPLSAALAGMLTGYFDFYNERLAAREVPLHDPLAAGIATGELTPLEAPLLGVTVDGNGQLLEDPQARTKTRVVLSLNAPAAPVIRRRILA